MSFKYPLLPPKDIIKAMKKLGFEKLARDIKRKQIKNRNDKSR